MPPRHVELPEFASESAVENALVPVLPKKTCRCDLPGWPGKTIGSSNAMWEKPQTVRNSPLPLTPGASSVGRIRSSLKPGAGAGSLVTSMAGPAPCAAMVCPCAGMEMAQAKVASRADIAYVLNMVSSRRHCHAASDCLPAMRVPCLANRNHCDAGDPSWCRMGISAHCIHAPDDS